MHTSTTLFFGLALAATYAGLWIVAITVSRSRRLMLLRAVTTTCTVVIILLILELPAMLKCVHWRLVFRSLSGEGVDYQTAYVLDESLSFRRIPGLHWSGRPASDIEERYGLPRSLKKPITFTYDRWGYRNATEIEEADIVLIGDSYVEGWYVSDEQTAASQLAERLGRPVANLGIAGYGTAQELRVLQGDAMDRRPNVAVWFFFEGNDLYNDQSFENAMLAAPPRAEETRPYAEGLTRHHGWKQRSFTLNAFRWLRRWAHPLVPNRAPYWGYLSVPEDASQRIYFADYGGVPWTEYEENRWARAQTNFMTGIEFAREHGVDLIFLYVPTKYRVYRDVVEIPAGSPMENWDVWNELTKRFLDFCSTASVPCVDLTGPLQEAAQQGTHVYAPTDTHWTPEGHALVAAELERLLHKLEGVSSRAASPASRTAMDGHSLLR